MLIECEKCHKIVAKHGETCRAVINIDKEESYQKIELMQNVKQCQSKDIMPSTQNLLSQNRKSCLEDLLVNRDNGDIINECVGKSEKVNGLMNKRKRLHFPLSSDDSNSDDEFCMLSKDELVSEIRLLTLVVKKLKRDNVRLKEKNLRLQEGLPLAICQLKEIALQLKSDKIEKNESRCYGLPTEALPPSPVLSKPIVLPDVHISSSSSVPVISVPTCREFKLSEMPELNERLPTLRAECKSPVQDIVAVEFSQSLSPVDLGNGIIIDSRQLERIQRANDYKKLTCHMMDIMFDRQELLTSSVSGKPSNVFKGAAAKPALDPYRVHALINYVLCQFPGTKPSDIKQKISQKLRDTRKLDKGKHILDSPHEDYFKISQDF